MALSGEEFVRSLRDGREVWLDGERVADVTTHAAFRPVVHQLAAMYDTLHGDDPALVWETERGARSHRAFRLARTRKHLHERAEAMRIWARRHWGFLGRTPDYKSGLAVSLGAWPEFFEQFADNATRWYQRMADDVLFLSHVGVNPMVDRSKPPHQLPDVNVRVVRERDDGFVVRGAKMVGTGAALTHANLVFSFAPVPLTDEDRDHALVFAVPTAAPGLRLLSRRALSPSAPHPLDHPLSSRFDENDATLIFDDVLIPWENCFVFRDPDRANRFFPLAQVTQNLMLHGGVRFATKLEFLCGLLIQLARSNGTIGLRPVRVRIGEALGYLQTFRALVRDACAEPDHAPNGTLAPSHRSIFAIRALAPHVYPIVRQTLLDVGGGGFVQLPSSARDMVNAELRADIDRYYVSADGDAARRVKLWKLAWDAVGSEFGARQELFERNYAGNPDNVRLENLFLAENDGDADLLSAMVDECLAGYGEGGWTE